MPKPLTNEQRQAISLSLERTDSAPSELSDDMLGLANDLSKIHGRIHVAREESGLHFYMAQPNLP